MDFHVDPDRLQRSGRTMQDAGVTAAGDLGRGHQDIAAGAATPWASDAALDAVYRELSAVTGEALDLVSGALRHGGAGVRAMADTYQRVDDAVGTSFVAIARGWAAPP